jgi:hypothetical protein
MSIRSNDANQAVYRKPGGRSVSADRLGAPVLCVLAVLLSLALGGCEEQAAEPPSASTAAAAAPAAATIDEDRSQLPIDAALSEYLAAEKIRAIKLVDEDGEVTTFDSSGNELLAGETPSPSAGSSMEPVPASAPVAGETLGSCTVGGTLRTCHRRGFPNANKYHLNGRHAGSCPCQ